MNSALGPVLVIDDQSDPGAYLDTMAHSPCLRVEEYEPREVEP